MRCISGMVKTPVVITLAVAEPETEPNRPEVTQATFAGPPAAWPVRLMAKSMKRRPAPERSTSAPKMMKRTM